MKIGMIGLGKMGEAIAYRIIQAGHEVIGFDPNNEACDQAEKEGVIIAKNIKDIVSSTLDALWLMVPQEFIDDVIAQIELYSMSGLIIIDGGNSKFTDSIRRSHMLADKGIIFLDCGTSGGLHGREKGFCLMIGGEIKAYEILRPLFVAVAAPNGYAHIGSSGTGHYVKMIHNGIEYGLLQAYAEGFQLLKEGSFKNERFNLARIAQLWNHGSIIRSWILELMNSIMIHDQDLAAISGEIESTGMGEWTVQEANAQNVPVSVIEKAVNIRALSKKTKGNYATKIVAMLRNAFGGHKVKTIQNKEE